jgi:hypothetical protein
LCQIKCKNPRHLICKVTGSSAEQQASYGGDWSAFGAGVLKGWSRVHGPLARPEFDVVTGVSTGALIAPCAFLGDAPSLDTIVDLYRNPRRDLVKQRWPLYFLPANESFATVPGLESELRAWIWP